MAHDFRNDHHDNCEQEGDLEAAALPGAGCANDVDPGEPLFELTPQRRIYKPVDFCDFLGLPLDHPYRLRAAALVDAGPVLSAASARLTRWVEQARHNEQAGWRQFKLSLRVLWGGLQGVWLSLWALCLSIEWLDALVMGVPREALRLFMLGLRQRWVEVRSLTSQAARREMARQLSVLHRSLRKNRVLVLLVILAGCSTTAQIVFFKKAGGAGFSPWQRLLLKYVIDLLHILAQGGAQAMVRRQPLFDFSYAKTKKPKMHLIMALVYLVIQAGALGAALYLPLAQLAVISGSWYPAGKMISRWLVKQKMTFATWVSICLCGVGVLFLLIMESHMWPGVVLIFLSAGSNGWKYFHQQVAKEEGEPDRRTAKFYASLLGLTCMTLVVCSLQSPWPPPTEDHIKLIALMLGFGVASELLQSFVEDRMDSKNVAVAYWFLAQVPANALVGYWVLGEPHSSVGTWFGMAVIAGGALATRFAPNGSGNSKKPSPRPGLV